MPLKHWLPAPLVLSAECLNCDGETHAAWRFVEGPASVVLQQDGFKATAAFKSPGNYLFRINVNSGGYPESREVPVLVLRSNTPPAVTAGPTQRVRGSALLLGRVDDDGVGTDGLLDAHPVVVQWSKISGPGSVSFADSNSAITRAEFSRFGEYVLQLTATDAGGALASDSVHVLVEADSPWEQFNGLGYASAGVGGLRGQGLGTIHLNGVHGAIHKAYLCWHGPTDSQWLDANAQVMFQGRWITGRPQGLSHSDGWNYRTTHPFANAQSYRADVSSLVTGDGDYSIAHLRPSDEVEVNGASLIVLFEEQDPRRRNDVLLWSGNESNGQYAPSVDGSVSCLAVQGDGKIILGGVFEHAGGFPRSGLARLKPDGDLDLDFDPGEGSDGTVLSIVEQGRTGIVIGGRFHSVGGVAREAIARLHPNGSLDSSFQASLPMGARVRSILSADDALWVAGSMGLWKLEQNGQLTERVVEGIAITALSLDPLGGIWCAGSGTGITGEPTSHLIHINSEGHVVVGALDANGAIDVLEPSLQGGFYVGGSFTQINGVERHGVAKVSGDGTLDLIWVPTELNEVEGQRVRSLKVQSAGPNLPGDSEELIVGGNIRLSTTHGTNLFAMIRLLDGSTQGENFRKLPSQGEDQVLAIQTADETGNLWIGGTFLATSTSLLAYQNRALINQGGDIVGANSGDEGWSLILEGLRAGEAADLELHVSDGQYQAGVDPP